MESGHGPEERCELVRAATTRRAGWVFLARPDGERGTAQAPSTLGTRPTSMADAVAVALRQNPDALTSESEVRGAEADARREHGGFFPKLHVDANVQQWNAPFAINFGGGRVHGPRTRSRGTASAYPHPAAHGRSGASTTSTRCRTSAWTSRTIRRQVTRREVAFQVVQAYYRLLEDERLAEVADDLRHAARGPAAARRSRCSTTASSARTTSCAPASPSPARSSGRSRCAARSTLARGQLDTLLGQPARRAVRARAFHRRSACGSTSRRVAVRREPRGRAAPGGARARPKHRRRPTTAWPPPRRSSFPRSTPSATTRTRRARRSSRRTRRTSASSPRGTCGTGARRRAASSSGTRSSSRRASPARSSQDQVRLEARAGVRERRDGPGGARRRPHRRRRRPRRTTASSRRSSRPAAATSFDVVDAEALLTQARGQSGDGALQSAHRPRRPRTRDRDPLPGEQ